MRIYFSFFILIVIISCNRSASKIEASKEDRVYNFDYKLKPNSTYQLLFESDAESLSRVEGKIDSSIWGHLPGAVDMLNSTSQSESRWQTSIVTSDQGERLSFKVKIDNVDENRNAPEVEKLIQNITPGALELTNENLIGISLDGYTVDQKKLLEKDSSAFIDSKSTLRPFIVGTNVWKSQEDYPSGKLRVGESFTWTTPKEKPQSNKRSNFAERWDSINNAKYPEKSAKIKKRRDSLRQERAKQLDVNSSHTKTFTLIKVEGNIAYFDAIEVYSFPGNIFGSTSESKGKSEYDLVNDYYRLYAKETNSIRTSTENGSSYISESRKHFFFRIVKVE